MDLEPSLEQDARKLANVVLLLAIRQGARAVHLEPEGEGLVVRLRLDGSLHEEQRLPPRLSGAVVDQLKLMAGLEVAEKRLPQDGRLSLRQGDGSEVGFALTTCPASGGEKVVLRRLTFAPWPLPLAELGMEPLALAAWREVLRERRGLVLLAGPTHSGRHTTLYAVLKESAGTGLALSTAEDPVRQTLPGVHQVELNDQLGLTFAALLRTYQRLDVDVVGLGDVRSYEDVELATGLALRGKLVVGTLHTQDVPTTLARLLNMGLEPWLVASAVRLVQAQRLLRRLCLACRVEQPLSETALRAVGLDPASLEGRPLYTTRGCDQCRGTGYLGLVLVHQTASLGPALREAVLLGRGSELLGQALALQGVPTLRQAALRQVAAGVTSLEEAQWATPADPPPCAGS